MLVLLYLQEYNQSVYKIVQMYFVQNINIKFCSCV